MPDIRAGFAMTLAPEKAIDWFSAKGFAPTLSWQDVQDEAHAVQFTVAGITKLDVLSDIHAGLDDALRNGTTLRQFQDKVIPMLEQKGWLGRGLVADKDGVLQGKKLMPYRLETIFRTNIQSAYASGRYQQQMSTVTERPYWEYCAVMDSRTRPRHASMNGRVFAADDPIWQTFYPPNGYNCRCWVRALTKAQLERHPVGLESSNGRLAMTQQAVGMQGETRSVMAYRDPKNGQLFTPDAGFHLNPGRGYLAGLGQSLLDKGVSAPPALSAVAVQEVLQNNRLASAMNRDIHQWVQSQGASGDAFRRVGALSPRVLSALHTDNGLPSPVITLTARAVQDNRDAGLTFWPRVISALYRPLAVLQHHDDIVILTGAHKVRLSPVADGFALTAISALSPPFEGVVLDGQLPEEA